MQIDSGTILIVMVVISCTLVILAGIFITYKRLSIEPINRAEAFNTQYSTASAALANMREEEVVSAIMAAIALYMGVSQDSFTIRSIRKLTGWSGAALGESQR